MRDRIFIWVEIPVSDMGRAKAFYERILATEMKSMHMGDEEYAFSRLRKSRMEGSWSRGRVIRLLLMALRSILMGVLTWILFFRGFPKRGTSDYG